MKNTAESNIDSGRLDKYLVGRTEHFDGAKMFPLHYANSAGDPVC